MVPTERSRRGRAHGPEPRRRATLVGVRFVRSTFRYSIAFSVASLGAHCELRVGTRASELRGAIVAMLVLGCDPELTVCREVDRVTVADAAVFEHFDREELEGRTAGTFVGVLSVSAGEAVELSVALRDRGVMERAILDGGESSPTCRAQEFLEQPATFVMTMDGGSSAELPVVIVQPAHNTLWPTFDANLGPGSALHRHLHDADASRGLRLFFEFRAPDEAHAIVESVRISADPSAADYETAVRIGEWSGRRDG